MTTDYWAPPVAASQARPPGPSRWRQDVVAFAGIVIASVFLGAPTGLLWAALVPHYVVHFDSAGEKLDDLESTKAFIGADGSYLLVMLGAGLFCGALAWFFARRYGPWTVAGLLLGGILAALIAASVGVRPGAQEAIRALHDKNRTSGTIEFPLVKHLQQDALGLRAPWAAVGWPVGALSVFLVGALFRPEDLD